METKQIQIQDDIDKTLLVVESWGLLKPHDPLRGHKICGHVNKKGKICKKRVGHGRHKPQDSPFTYLYRYHCECGLKFQHIKEVRRHLRRVRKQILIEATPGHRKCPICGNGVGYMRHIIEGDKVKGFDGSIKTTKEIRRYVCQCGFKAEKLRDFIEHLKKVSRNQPLAEKKEKEWDLWI